MVNENTFVKFFGVRVFVVFFPLSESWCCERCLCLTLIRQPGLDIIQTTTSHSGQWSATLTISDFSSIWQEVMWNTRKCNLPRLSRGMECEASHSGTATESWDCWQHQIFWVWLDFPPKDFFSKTERCYNFSILINFASELPNLFFQPQSPVASFSDRAENYCKYPLQSMQYKYGGKKPFIFASVSI